MQQRVNWANISKLVIELSRTEFLISVQSIPVVFGYDPIKDTKVIVPGKSQSNPFATNSVT